MRKTWERAVKAAFEAGWRCREFEPAARDEAFNDWRRRWTNTPPISAAPSEGEGQPTPSAQPNPSGGSNVW